MIRNSNSNIIWTKTPSRLAQGIIKKVEKSHIVLKFSIPHNLTHRSHLRCRYCYLIFWWIEAVYASRDQDEERTREALYRARTPSSMELYLFLQAFIHCTPLAIINALDMMVHYANPAFDKSTCYKFNRLTVTYIM